MAMQELINEYHFSMSSRPCHGKAKATLLIVVKIIMFIPRLNSKQTLILCHAKDSHGSSTPLTTLSGLLARLCLHVTYVLDYEDA